MFTISVNIDGLERKLNLCADAAEDLEKPLRVFGGWLRKQAIKRYEQQAFPPLAAATLAARARKGLDSAEGKLRTDLRRAKTRADATGKRSQGFMARVLGLASNSVLSPMSRGVQNRMAVLEEFQRRHRKDFVEGGQLRQLSLKQQASLTQRTARSVERSVGRPILGGLPRTLGIIVDGQQGNVTLKSVTHEKWSAAHNEGATVGRGVKLPKRETVKLESNDLQVLESILKTHLLLPFEDGMHGPAF